MKLAGAVASGNMNLAITNVLMTYSHKRWLSLAEIFCWRILIGKCMCRGFYIYVYNYEMRLF